MKFEDKKVLDFKVTDSGDCTRFHFHLEDSDTSDGQRIYGVSLSKHQDNVRTYVQMMKAFVYKFEQLNGEEIPWPESYMEEVPDGDSSQN